MPTGGSPYGTANAGDVDILGGSNVHPGVSPGWVNISGGESAVDQPANAGGSPLTLFGGRSFNKIKADTTAGAQGGGGGGAGGQVHIKGGGGDYDYNNTGPHRGGNVLIEGGEGTILNYDNGWGGGGIGDGGNVTIEPGKAGIAGGELGRITIGGTTTNKMIWEDGMVGIGDDPTSILNSHVPNVWWKAPSAGGNASLCVEGDLTVKGNIDPTGLYLTPQTENPFNTTAYPSMPTGSPVPATTMWADSVTGRLMFGEETVARGGHSSLATADPSVSPYIVVATDEVVFADLSSLTGDVEVKLPDAAADPGRTITIKDRKGLSGGEYAILVTSAGGNIDGETEAEFHEAWGAATFVSDGTDWLII